MKKLLYILLSTIPIVLKAQTDPQWVMPIVFEDATGERDTIYIGYDPSADFFDSFDDEFEDYIWIDTSKFNVIIEQASPATGVFYSDSCKIREITSTTSFGSIIKFVNGQMPISMSWDMTLMYSEDLPFPNIFPLPNAVAFIYCGAGEPGYINCPSAIDEDPLSMTDQPNINYDYPISSPHLFDGSGTPPSFDEPDEVISTFQILFLPYDTHTDIVSLNNLSKLKIFPIPFDQYLNVNSQEIISSITITNLFGETVYKSEPIKYNETICTTGFPSGIYQLSLLINKNKITQTIIKP